MTYPTDKQVEAAARAIALIDWQPQMIDKVWINYIDVASAAIIAADQAAWLPIDQAPHGDDIDLIGLFETPAGRFVSGCISIRELDCEAYKPIRYESRLK